MIPYNAQALESLPALQLPTISLALFPTQNSHTHTCFELDSGFEFKFWALDSGFRIQDLGF